MSAPRTLNPTGSRLVVLLPYLWLVAFLLAPFLIVLKLSLSQVVIAQPPYAPILDLSAGLAGLQAFIDALSLENYRTLLSDTLYITSFLKSLQVASISTLLLMAVALPIAYAMSRSSRALQPALAIAVMLPFWTAFLIRIYAWVTILQREGLINHVLARAAHHRRADPDAGERRRGLYRDRLFLFAVHGAADLCGAVENG